jgi:AICAR transformylase/IMP cyclohydrolase PurH/REP element-mobilizing transposase RayT
MSDPIKIRRALISVYDKTGIVEFARALHDEFGIEIISTGGTAKTLTDAGIPVTLVEDITGFPEMLDGRVKTLHPKIHAAILADRDNPEHMRQLKEQGIEPIDMVVVNLYPFEETIRRPDCTFEEAIEMIDIGGPCLLRAAAKNQKHVLVAGDPAFYDSVVDNLRQWHEASVRDDLLTSGGFAAFWQTCGYDGKVAQWLSNRDDDGSPVFKAERFLSWGPTRYGENPHQRGKLLQRFGSDPEFDLLTADANFDDQNELSFNNYADASAALELCAELTRAGDRLWHRFVTGDLRQRERVDSLVEDERLTRRNLPHIQKPGATYFVTFRLQGGHLGPPERDIALSACRFWHGEKMTLHCAVVMPDHVHMLLTPHEIVPDQWVSLGELMHSIKRQSSREINKLRGVTGSLWLDETFDRVVRDEAEFREKWDYIEANPVTAGVATNLPYPWFWRSNAGFMERIHTGEQGEDLRLQTGATVESGATERNHRLQTGATGQAHQLQTGATGSGCAVCFIKHTNACGTAVARPEQLPQDASEAQRGAALHEAQIEAYRRAYLGDPNAAMGGVLAVDFPVDAEFAEAVMETYQRWGKPLKEAGASYAPGAFFIEVWLAPSFDDEAVRIIRGQVDGKPQKAWGQRVRLLDVGDMGVEPDPEEMDFKRIAGGVLTQTRDLIGLNEDEWKVVTERQPTGSEMDDLRLAWLVCKHTRSNAITICKDGMLLGNGAGQMSRVMSCRIATWLAKENGHAERLKGAAAASDAFFPFRDGPDILIDAGVTAIIQPGGSKRDPEVIAACNERGAAMIFTGTRHFRH